MSSQQFKNTIIDPWMLSRRDAETIEELRDWIWNQRRNFSHEILELIALAGFVAALGSILSREELECDIRLSWEGRVSDEYGFGEVSSCIAPISDDGIQLSKMIYIGGSFSGDHSSETVADLNRDGDFPHEAVREWLTDCSGLDGSLRCDISALVIGS